MMVKSNISDNLAETDSTMLNPFLVGESERTGQGLFMPESAQEIKRMTFPDKYSILGKGIRTTNSLRTSVADSISKEKDFAPYWNESCLEMSKKLLSHTETGCAGSDLNLLTVLQEKTTANSWFSITHSSHLKKNLSETLFPLSTFSRVGFTDSGNTLIRSRRIRIYPNSESRELFKRYCGLSRFWFNQTVFYLRQPNTIPNIKCIRSIVQNRNLLPEWAFDSPQRIREHAISDACKAVKNARAKSKKTQKLNEVHYRCKKDVKQRFGFDGCSLSEGFVFRDKKYKIYFRSSERFSADLEGCEICNENGRWFLIVPEEISIKKPENQRLGVVALDPGVRTFMAYYSDSCCGVIGKSDFSRIFRLCYSLDEAISKRTRQDYKGRKRFTVAIQRLRWKIRDSIDEIHHKVALFLVKNFDEVLIPTFETSDMVTTMWSNDSARAMLTWAHYRFKEFLKFKGKEYSCKVTEVNEAYTSRTCSYCGKLHNIRNKKHMKCSCGVNVDRDLNGARGIYLRNLN